MREVGRERVRGKENGRPEYAREKATQAARRISRLKILVISVRPQLTNRSHITARVLVEMAVHRAKHSQARVCINLQKVKTELKLCSNWHAVE